MTDITEQLLKNRPKLTKNSIKTYKSILTNLHKTIDPSGQISVEWFIKEQPKIIKHLEPLNFNTRKLKLAALVVLTSHDSQVSDKYQKMMLKDITQYNDEQKEQKKTPTQEENWMTLDQVKKVHQDLKEATTHLFKKDNLTPKERQLFQDYVILSLYILNPPRRLLDYTDMSWVSSDDSQNYMKGKKFIFNNYKTAKKYGQQIVDISPKLYYILNKWKKLQPEGTKFILTNEKGEKLTPSALTFKLNKIFGKKISVNMLRHIFISDEVLKDMPALTKLEETARDMGHTLNQAILYKKND